MSNVLRRADRSDPTDILEWKRKVLERDENRCVNCEKKERVAACFIIPPESGGTLKVSNGATICRDCRISAEGARVLPLRIDNKTPINFLISRPLHNAIDKLVHEDSNFGSKAALVRSLISSFITEPQLYEDVDRWQDPGSDVKVNGWVDGAQYEVFKRLCQDRGMSYTDVLKGLLLMAVDRTPHGQPQELSNDPDSDLN